MNFPAHGLFLRGEEFGDGSLYFFVVEIVFRCGRLPLDKIR